MGDVLTEASALLGRAEKGGEKPLFQQAAAKYVQATATAAEIKDLYWEIGDYVWLGFIAEKLEEKFDDRLLLQARVRDRRASRRRWTCSRSTDPGESSRRLSRGGLRDDLIDVTLPLDESKKKYADTLAKKDAEAVNPGARGHRQQARGRGAASAAAGGGPRRRCRRRCPRPRTSTR